MSFFCPFHKLLHENSALSEKQENKPNHKKKKKKAAIFVGAFSGSSCRILQACRESQKYSVEMSQQCVWAALYKWIDQLFGKPKLQNESNPVNKAANEENAALYDGEDRNDGDNAV